ncbi:hypothetical protein WN944_028411 [Citrus x changshan-huyou]|uniref:Uncharacterized protein n=1 Tax=Citrus x changshan-huyou TaxID=2935761 RepID=A0AAP0LNR9_9ROSI
MCICGNAEGQREKNSGACHRLFACTPTAVLRVTTPHLVLLPLLSTSQSMHLGHCQSVALVEATLHTLRAFEAIASSYLDMVGAPFGSIPAEPWS